MPTTIGVGFLNKRLKSASEISSAIPNITNANAKFKTQSVSELKFIRTVSSTESVKNKIGVGCLMNWSS